VSRVGAVGSNTMTYGCAWHTHEIPKEEVDGGDRKIAKEENKMNEALTQTLRPGDCYIYRRKNEYTGYTNIYIRS